MSVYDDMHECDTNLLKKPYYLCNRKKCGDKCIDECYLTSDLFYAADGIDRSQYEAYRFFSDLSDEPHRPSFKSKLLNPYKADDF
jgi:hypothetical protein